MPVPVELQTVRFGYVQTDRGVLVTLNGKQYEILSKNTAELIRWMRQAKQQLYYYRKALRRCNAR